MTDGRRLDGYTISSPCEPNGSGELKMHVIGRGWQGGGGLDWIKNAIIQSLQFYAQFAKIMYCNWLKVLIKSII